MAKPNLVTRPELQSPSGVLKMSKSGTGNERNSHRTAKYNYRHKPKG